MTIKELQQIFPNATLETWHQHKNGGGWVENTTTVDDTVYIAVNARVCLLRNNSISKRAKFYIQGTQHSMNLTKHGELRIGCMIHPLAYWKKHYKAIGRKEKYSTQQIAEYAEYIKIFSRIDRQARKKK